MVDGLAVSQGGNAGSNHVRLATRDGLPAVGVPVGPAGQVRDQLRDNARVSRWTSTDVSTNEGVAVHCLASSSPKSVCSDMRTNAYCRANSKII